MSVFQALTYFVLISVPLSQTTQLQPMKFMHRVSLDLEGDFVISWTPNDESFTMEMSAKTTGYLSVGFSPNGGMKGSDIFIGWVTDQGQVMGKDTFADAKSAPKVDKSQDFKVLGGMQNDTHTTIRFQRNWDTCDGDEDMMLGQDTVRIIWAFHEEDPSGESDWQYHGPERGVRSLHLKEPAKPKMPQGDDVKIWDIKSDHHILPNDHDTYYGCQMFKVPPLRKKHQIIAFEPLIQPGHESYVHHLALYECYPHPDAKKSGVSSRDLYESFFRSKHKANCAGNHLMPQEWLSCKAGIAFAWAIGGEGEILPQEAGIPMCERWGGATYYMLEIHYDNPHLHRDIMDESGVRVYYTDKVRPNDSGTLSIAAMVNDTYTISHVIPPKQKAFLQSSFCTESCTGSTLPEGGIVAYNGILHSHLAGRKLRLRHIRDGKELAPIMNDDHYDFNYQAGRHLNVTILPGDSFIMECEYDTADREDMTINGLGTSEEMCTAFFLVYPRPKLSVCGSAPTFGTHLDAMKMNWTYGEYEFPKTVVEIKTDLWEKYRNTDWEQHGQHFEHAMRYGSEYFFCFAYGGEQLAPYELVEYPKFEPFNERQTNACENYVEN